MFDLNPEFLEINTTVYDSSIGDGPPKEWVCLSYDAPETESRIATGLTLERAVDSLRQKLWEDELRKERGD